MKDYHFDFNTLPIDVREKKIYLYKWLIADGELVQKGQPLFIIKVGESISPLVNISKPIESVSNGIIQIYLNKNEEITKNLVVYTIHSFGSYEKENLPENPTYYSYFNKYKYSIPESLKYSEKTLEIEKWYFKNGDYVNKGDTIFSFCSSRINRAIGSLSFEITGYQSSENQSFRHIAERNGYLEIKATTLDGLYLQQGCLLYAIHDNISFITSSKELSKSSHEKVNEECFVYLMIDTTNNFYKIGISNKPEWREKTLQSEKPTIELLAAKGYVNRTIAASFEKALHDTYSAKRIRGEWFKLDKSEVDIITRTLND